MSRKTANRRERRPNSDARTDLRVRLVLVASALGLPPLVVGIPPSSAVDRSRFGAPATTSADMILSEERGALRLAPPAVDAGRPERVFSSGETTLLYQC